MRKLILTVIYGCMAAFALAQAPTVTGTVKGTIIDSAKNTPLSYVTIAIKDAATQKPVKSALTADNGSFTLIVPTSGNYTLTINAVGYQPQIITIPAFTQTDKAVANLGLIKISAASSQLKEVAVVASKPLIKQEIDRTTYDVQADPDSKALTAMEMLRKVPQVTVDGDDNIQLQGSSSYKIFINGKPSALMASNPKDVLRSMPANTIQKIEIITNPPAKYDAEGLAGIINIITTKKTDDGYNGTLTGRYNYPWGPNTNLTGTYKQGKFGLSGYAGIGRQLPVTIGSGNFRQTYGAGGTPDVASELLQQGTSSFGGRFMYSSAELSFEADSLNLLTGSVNFNNGRFNQDYNRYSAFSNDIGVPVQTFQLFNNGGFNWRGIDLGINYQLGFAGKKDRLLTTSYKYSYSLNGQNSSNQFSQRFNYTNPDYNQLIDAGSREHTLQLDYVHPMSKLKVEAGAKAILRNNFSNAQTQRYSTASSSYVNVAAPANDFKYQQNVYSVYNSYQLQLARYTFKAGLRVEHTTVDADFFKTTQTPASNYTNFVPSVSVMRNFKNNQSLTLGFTNRIERPGIYQLNPFIDSTNLRFWNSGNPNLRPVLIHRFEASYNKSGKGSFGVRASYNFLNNSFENITSLINDTTSLSTYQNTGKRRNAGLGFNISYPLSKTINVTLDAALGYIWFNGTYQNQPISNSGARGNYSFNASYKPNDAWRFGVSNYYSSPYIQLQGQSTSWISASINVSRTFLNKKATLTAYVNNPYQKFRTYRSYTEAPDFYQTNTSSNYYRTFSFSFAYKFGKLSSDIKKNQRGISNDDVKSGGNGNGTSN